MRPLRHIGVAVAVVLVSAALVPHSAEATPTSQRANAAAQVRRHTLSDGSGYAPDARYKPRIAYLSGDGTLMMYRSAWTHWIRDRAVGRGIGHVDLCIPSCADGPIVHEPMRLIETAPRKACGIRVFTRYRVVFRARPTSNYPRILRLHRWPITC